MAPFRNVAIAPTPAALDPSAKSRTPTLGLFGSACCISNPALSTSSKGPTAKNIDDVGHPGSETNLCEVPPPSAASSESFLPPATARSPGGTLSSRESGYSDDSHCPSIILPSTQGAQDLSGIKCDPTKQYPAPWNRKAWPCGSLTVYSTVRQKTPSSLAFELFRRPFSRSDRSTKRFGSVLSASFL